MTRPSFATLRLIDDLHYSVLRGDKDALAVLEDLIREHYTGQFLERMLAAHVTLHRPAKVQP